MVMHASFEGTNRLLWDESQNIEIDIEIGTGGEITKKNRKSRKGAFTYHESKSLSIQADIYPSKA